MNDTSKPLPDLLEAIFEAHPAPTFVIDGDAGVRAMNQAARLMLGRERGAVQLEPRPAGDVLRCVESYGPGGCGRQERCKSCVVRNAIVHALSTGSVQRAQTVMRVRGEGGEAQLCLLVSASPILHGGRELAVVTLQDVSDVVCLQERAVRAERLASVATLVRGVCHEVNNPLGSLLPNLSYAREQIATALGDARVAGAPGARACLEDLDQTLRDASQAADRVREIVADLRAFTSGEYSGEARCELRGAVERALELATDELAPCAAVEVAIPARLPQIAASCAELAHVFASLLSNAGQATAGGMNTVRVAARTRDPEHIEVEVSDTGAGIDDADLSRVFDPFFSTRGVGRGKGLGLSVCLGIVRSLGGDIALRSAPGKGTTVTVVLPGAASTDARLGRHE